MSNIDLFRMGIKNLWRRKLRTFLTVLGVIIGASSIIVMLSLGFGLSKSFEESMAQWGSLTTVQVHKGWSEPQPGKKEAALDNKAVTSFKEIPNVVAVSPTITLSGTIINGKYVANARIKGIDPDSMKDFGFEVEKGRTLNKSDELTIVFGNQMQNNFYDPRSRVWREPKIDLMKDRMTLSLDPNYGFSSPGSSFGNKEVKYKEYKLKVAGVLKQMDWETDYGVYMPITEVQKLLKEKDKIEGVKPQSGKRNKFQYDQISVKVDDIKNVQAVQNIIKNMGHEAWSLNDELESMKKQAGVIQAVLGGIGAVSLLVAAIGITNTMVMSIYERTKEIGVMKVIGASLKDIKRLFLFESALIGLTGGIFGIGFSYLISFFINKLSPQFGQAIGAHDAVKISIIPIWLTFAAMAFSAFIGIVSGYFPARRAMNLSALEAIRTE